MADLPQKKLGPSSPSTTSLPNGENAACWPPGGPSSAVFSSPHPMAAGFYRPEDMHMAYYGYQQHYAPPYDMASTGCMYASSGTSTANATFPHPPPVASYSSPAAPLISPAAPLISPPAPPITFPTPEDEPPAKRHRSIIHDIMERFADTPGPLSRDRRPQQQQHQLPDTPPSSGGCFVHQSASLGQHHSDGYPGAEPGVGRRPAPAFRHHVMYAAAPDAPPPPQRAPRVYRLGDKIDFKENLLSQPKWRLVTRNNAPDITFTVGELKRRAETTERFSESEFATLLMNKSQQRRVKALLEKFDIQPPLETSIKRTHFTFLAEDEASVLARDFAAMLRGRHVQPKRLARRAVTASARSAAAPDALPTLRKLLEAIEHSFAPFSPASSTTRGCSDDSMPNHQSPLTVQTFSVLTHTFGVAAVREVTLLLERIAKEAESVVKQMNTVSPPPSDDSFQSSSAISPSSPSPSSLFRSPFRSGGRESSSSASSASSSSSYAGTLSAQLECLVKLSPQHDDDILFDWVEPRLMDGGQKNRVTRGEIRRRVLGPERLHASAMQCFLRRAKKKNSYELIRSELADIGIQLENGQKKVKKGMEDTCFSSLTESESAGLADDAACLLGHLLPPPPLLFAISETKQRTGSSSSGTLEQCRLFLEVIAYVVEQLARADEADPFRIFDLATHGFGPRFIAYVCRVFAAWIPTERHPYGAIYYNQQFDAPPPAIQYPN